MTQIDSTVTVGQLVADQPNRSRIFEELGIDYCCGGKQPLVKACALKGLNVEDVVARLAALPKEHACDTSAMDVASMPLDELADHIVTQHHDYLRRELPRLAQKLERVAEVHGEKDRRLTELHYVFSGFMQEIASHLMKEERILFPAIRALSAGNTETGFCFASIEMPIGVMEAEHEMAGNALEKMRELTDAFNPPAWACNTYRAALDGLRELEQDMHQHIHKENNILFQKAVALNSEIAAA